MSNYTLIEDSAALASACSQLQRYEWLALDTEFIREKTFYPNLCLIQVATPDLQLFCIDPLAVDIGPLLDVLYDPAMLTVWHAARQDLEILYHLRGSVPAPIFDTQIAAPLLGYADQIGYGNLVKERLGIELAKGHSRTDWQQRPLAEAQLRYAADDVRYLAELYPGLHDELAGHGRLDWLQEDFATLLHPDTYRLQPDTAWHRLKGIVKLKGASLAIAQDLAAWRETTAEASDRPRKWILADDTLLTLARLKPKQMAELERVRGLPPQVIRKQGETLLQRINAARDRKPVPLPEFKRPAALSAAEDAAVDLLTGAVRLIADRNQLNPSVIASRKDLEKLLRNDADCALLHGWRARLAGRELQSILAGETRLGIEHGALRFITSD